MMNATGTTATPIARARVIYRAHGNSRVKLDLTDDATRAELDPADSGVVELFGMRFYRDGMGV